MAAKKTPEWVPLCHSGVGLEGVRVRVEVVGPWEGLKGGGVADEMMTMRTRRSEKVEDGKERKVNSNNDDDYENNNNNTDYSRGNIIPTTTTTTTTVNNSNNENKSPQPQPQGIGPHGGIRISATVECTAKTGVEMEALTAVVGAGLTVIDMCKGVDKGLRMEGVRVVRKEGGRSGDWRAEG